MLLGTQEKAKKLAVERMEKKLSKHGAVKPKPSPRQAGRDSRFPFLFVPTLLSSTSLKSSVWQ